MVLVWELINQKNIYGMLLFLWTNLWYFGAFWVCFPISLDLFKIFSWSFVQIFLLLLYQSQYEKILWHVTLSSEPFFGISRPILGMFLYTLWKLQYFLMIFCTESLFITLVVTNQKEYYVESLSAKDILGKNLVY